MRRVLLFALLASTAACYALERQPNSAYQARRQALAQKTNGGVVLLFADVEAEGPNDLFGFRQNNDFYYLSGWTEPGAALLIAPPRPASGPEPARPYTEVLFLPAHNNTQEKWTGPKLGPEDPRAPALAGFDRVESLDKIRDALLSVLPPTFAQVYSDLPAWNQTSASTGALEWLRRANSFPTYVSFADAKPLIAALRRIKDDGEIALIRKATNASMAAHRAAMHALKPGLSERYIAGLMTGVFEEHGCERPAYAPIVGAGFNSTVLHYSADDGPIAEGDVVVIDVAGEYSMYASDITRTLPANGRFTSRQREIYDIVLGAQRAAMQAFQAGKSTLARSGPNSLYQVAYDYLNTHGKDAHGQPLGRYFIHGLSHYVGLSVHDVGDVSAPLVPGAVFTIEPGIYIPEEKIGVRIEDIFYVDQSGKLVDLTAGLPHTPEEIEAAIQAH